MIDRPSVIAAAGGFYQVGNQVSQWIVFEDKYLIYEPLTRSPNIGVVFPNQENAQNKHFAVECKFTKPYSKRRDKPTSILKYLNVETIWEDIPYIQDFFKVN